VKKVRETKAPGVPNRRCDQRKMRRPRATLKSAVIARAAISIGKWSWFVS
jgi:hypothetical protein